MLFSYVIQDNGGEEIGEEENQANLNLLPL